MTGISFGDNEPETEVKSKAASVFQIVLDAQLRQDEIDKRTKLVICSVMKNGILSIASVALSFSVLSGLAQNVAVLQSSSPSDTATVTAKTTEPVKLPYGVEDVLKLSRAQVSEEVITTYIQNTGTIYDLKPKDIVYLKEQGVSDRIINTMMDQRRIANEVAAQAQQQQAATQQPAVVADNNNPVTTPAYAEPEPAAPVIAQPAASSLYIIPYPTPAYPRYSGAYYYPYTYSYPYTYYSTCRPVVGFRFGVGRSFHSFHHHR